MRAPSSSSVFCVRPRRFNVGNETINLATRGLLRRAFGETLNVIPVPAQRSEEEGSSSGVTARTVHDMNRLATGVVIGGGNLYENGQLDVDPNALRALRPPLLLQGLSYGRIFDDRGRLQRRTDAMPDATIRTLHEGAVGSLARDHATIEHLHGLGLKDAVLAGCPTLFLGDLLGDTALAPAPRGAEAPVLLSIRAPALMSVPLADQARLQGELRRTIDALESRGLGPVHLLCHDKRDLELAASFPEQPQIFPDDVHDYLALLRGARLLLSFRLHAFLPCLSFGTPAINVSYDERSQSLAETIGLGSWDIRYLDEPDLAAAIADRVDRLDNLTRLVDDARPTWATFADVTQHEFARFAAACTEHAAAADAVG